MLALTLWRLTELPQHIGKRQAEQAWGKHSTTQRATTNAKTTNNYDGRRTEQIASVQTRKVHTQLRKQECVYTFAKFASALVNFSYKFVDGNTT